MENLTENQNENLEMKAEIIEIETKTDGAETAKTEASESAKEALENTKRESKSERAAPDYPAIKVQLPREAALKVQVALQTLKDRKADTKVDELLSEFLDSITEEYLEAQIEKRTPEDYYFEAAKTIPELREKIIQQAKKALQQSTNKPVILSSSETKKAKKKEKMIDSHVMVEGTNVTQ